MIKQTTQLLVLGTVALVLVSAISGCTGMPEPTPSPTPSPTPTPAATPLPPPTSTPNLQDQLVQQLLSARATATALTPTPSPPPRPTATATPPPTPTPFNTGHPNDPCGPSDFGYYGDYGDLHEHFIHWAGGGTHLVFDHDDLILVLDIAGAEVREVADADATTRKTAALTDSIMGFTPTYRRTALGSSIPPVNTCSMSQKVPCTLRVTRSSR